LKLSEAKANLAELDRSFALTKVDAARKAITDAGQDLDRVVRELAVTQDSDNTWVTEIVTEAFSKLTAARATLADLEKIAASEGS
jgi:hypothetical protein